MTPLCQPVKTSFLRSDDCRQPKPGKCSVGIDVGSRTTKVVVLKDQCILASAITDTGVHAAKSAEKAFGLSRRQAGLSPDAIGAVVGTGYGRISLSFADSTATELTCHARGCHFMNASIGTVVDIGGQDSKVMTLDDAGQMIDFVMNDKCAAGTGKFLEMVARTLEMDLPQLGDMEAPTARPCTVNSMCVVFAETEIISLLAKGEAVDNIVCGINKAFAMRIGNMVKRMRVRKQMAFVGGVAKNRGLARALADYLDRPFTSLDIDPQLTGALGAAVLARQMMITQG